MTLLRPGEIPGRAIAVFPFLKTTGAVCLGSFTFRSTEDINDLSEEDARPRERDQGNALLAGRSPHPFCCLRDATDARSR
jgi:hypothetical protein